MGEFTTIRLSNEVANLIRKECRIAFVESNPKFVGLNISDDFMVRKIVSYYLEDS